jgi:hypothetical protein
MKKRGAPIKTPGDSKKSLVQIRLNDAEKQAFLDASRIDGKKMSEWIRDRLRKCSQEELQAHGQNVPFLPTRG